MEQSRGLSETVEAIKQLRALGATRVRIGHVSADFGGAEAVPLAVMPEPELTPEEAERKRKAEYEADLFRSAG